MKSKIQFFSSAMLFTVFASPMAMAAVFTYNNTNSSGTATSWAGGAGWSSVPVSATDTTLTFSGTLAASTTILTNNDVTSPPFKLNIFNMNYAGPTSGTAPTVTLQGNQLEFISNGAPTPTMTFLTTGTIKPVVTINNNLLLTNNLAVTATTDGKLSGVISGAGNLSKSGSGVLSLTGSNNSYTGTTTVSNGILDLGLISNGSLGGGGLFLSNNAVIQGRGTFTRGFATSPTAGTPTAGNGQVAAGSAGFAAKGGSLTVTFTGGTVFLSGATNSNRFGDNFIFGSAAADSSVIVTNDINLNGSNRLFTVNSGLGGDYAELSGAISVTGTWGINKGGTGLLLLSGVNTFAGTTTITSGTLKYAKQTSLYNNTSASWTAANIKVASGGTIAFNVGGTNEFTTSDITTLLTNLGGLGAAPGNGLGLQGGSTVAFDTTNASGNNFTVADFVKDSTGTGGGTIGLLKQGTGTLTISGTNSYTGGTVINGGGGTINVQGDQSAANGGWSIGLSSPATTSTVNFQSGSTVTVAIGKTVQIGASSQIGSTNQNSQVLNVAGTVTNAGTLLVGREGALTINSGGVWTQNGSMNLSSLGGVALSMTVNSGGSFIYAGSTAVGINSAPSNIGSPTLIVAGGIFTTGKGFVNNTATSTGIANMLISGGGTLKLSADVSDLTSTAGGAFNFQLGTGGGTIDTQSFSTSMSRVISDASGQTGSLKKEGVGTLTLAGVTNIYSGGTTLSGGKLVLSHNSAAGTAGIAVSGGGTTLEISSGILIANNVTVSDSTASVVHGIAAAGAYNVGSSGTLKSSFATATPDTTAKILAGSSSSAATLTMSFSGSSLTTNDAARRSDVFTIGGTGTDLYVLQLSASGLAADSVLAYHNGSIWDLAVTGNTGTNNATLAQQNYAGAFSAFQTTFGATLSSYQGAYGIDTTTNSLWAVVNYGGSFSAVPEPSSALAGLLVGAGVLRRRRNLRWPIGQ